MRAPSGMPALPRKLLCPGELLPQWEPGRAQSLLVTVQFCHSVYHVGAWAWEGCIPGASLKQMNTFQKSYRISLYLQGDILGEIFN